MPQAQPRRLEALAEGLASILASDVQFKPGQRKKIEEATEALRQGEQFLASVPLIIQERTEMIALHTSMKCAAIMNSVADDYEQGARPPTTSHKALRDVAKALVLSQQEIAREKIGLQPKRKKSKLIGVG